MSCKVLVDYGDSLDSCQNNVNNPFRRNCSNNFNLLTYITRLLYFRRLRLFKIYMTGIVAIFLLFLFLRHRASESKEQLIAKNGFAADENANIGHIPLPGETKLADDLNQIQSVQQVQSITDQYSPLVGQNSYPNNVTFSLTMRDFKHMKNVNVMQVRIREAMKHSWDNYRRYAWGYDMLKPRAKEPDHWFNLGLTIVDSADTLIMMGLTNDANLAIDWIENKLKFTSTNENSNCFELTIRILAGILTAYHMTAREKLKYQAVQMGDKLLHCYDTESRVIPYSDIDLSVPRAHPPQWNPHSSLSEVASLQLEFRYLSQISGNMTYEQTTFETSKHIHNLTLSRVQKLLPMYINPSTGQFEDSLITLGARADSYYEYLLKQYIQTGIKWLEDDYLDSVDAIEAKMLRYTDGADNYTYVAEMQVYRNSNDTEDIKYYNKMDHLVCFLPGTLALGYYHYSPLASENRLKHNLETPSHKLNSRYDNHLKMAQDLARTCFHMYSEMGTGLSPEIASFVHVQPENPLVQNQPEIQVQSGATHNILRPEFVESLFYLYHVTGLPKYRHQASQVFEAFQNYSRIPSGYSPVSDVREKPPANANLDDWLYKNAPDRMESFWLSETLKYLYLVFCDDRHIVGTLLNNYIFNTEAHVFPIL